MWKGYTAKNPSKNKEYATHFSVALRFSHSCTLRTSPIENTRAP